MTPIATLLRHRGAALGALALLLMPSCSSEMSSATAVTVSVMSDPELKVSRISYNVFDSDKDPARDAPVTSFVSEGAQLNRPFVVEKRSDNVFLLVVQGFTADNLRVPVVEQRVRAQFENEKTGALHLFLSGACQNNLCGGAPNQTCYGGKPDDALPVGACGPIPGPYLLPAITMPGQEDDWLPPPVPPRDAGADTGLDSGPDPAPIQDAGADAAPDADSGPDPVKCALRDGSVCNPLPGCNTCGTGQHCLPSEERTVCWPSLPAGKKAGESCGGNVEECGSGLTCWYGICKTFCASNADCPAGDTCGVGDSGYGACNTPCGTGKASCPVGTSCTTLNVTNLKGDYCTVPYATCPESYLNNDVCSEVGGGSGVCAAGTDGDDCCTPTSSRTSCEVDTQCGCSATDACYFETLVGTKPKLACAKAGTLAQNAACTADEDCAKGLGCYGKFCSKFCTESKECGPGGFCNGTTFNGMDVDGVKTCMDGCNFDSPACPTGKVCANFGGTLGSLCIIQSATTCPTANDGICDEIYRRCAAGTDTADCAAPTP